MLLLCLVWALAQVPGKCQVLRTNAAGEKIIVYPDGTARYFNDLSPVTGPADGEETTYPVLSVDIEPLGEALTPTENDLRRIAERRLSLAREALELAGTRVRAAAKNRERIASQIAVANQAGDLSSLGSLQRQATLASKTECEASNDEVVARALVEQTESTIANNSYVAAYNEDRRRRNTNRLPLATTSNRRGQQFDLLSAKQVSFTGYGSADARHGIGEALPCRPATALKASNGARPKTPLLPFFSYTDEGLRPFLEGKEYLVASAYTSTNAGGANYLHLNFSFSNASARNAYGTLPAGTSLSVHLLNGRSLTLSGERESVGIFNHQRQTLNYDVDYPLSRADTQLLQREAIDYVRVFWSGGYEEYPVARVDAVKHMCRCL